MKRKITMYSSQTASIQELFQQFLSAASANGFSERTLKMYRQHLHSISKHLDIVAPPLSAYENRFRGYGGIHANSWPCP